jgi:membrane protease YdiL (CAAX protease family)
MAERVRIIEPRPIESVPRPADGEAPESPWALLRTAGTRGQWAWAAGWTIFVAAAAARLAVDAGKTGLPLVAAISALVILTLPYMGFGFTSLGQTLQAWVRRAPLAPAQMLFFFMAVYLAYALGTGSFDLLALVRIQAFVATPLVIIMAARSSPAVTWLDFVAIACIWLPFNFGQISSIWTWPEGEAAYILNTPLAVDLALCLFLGLRRFPESDLRFAVKARSLPFVAACLFGFMMIAVPFGLGTGFLTWHPQLNALKLIGQPLAIFFFIAVPEELLFRGLVQGLLARRTGKPVLALVVASLLFGASHWHNPGWPDFRYLGLAAVAGLFYGWAYLRTGSIATSALLHAAVDSLWELFFHV